MSHQITITTGIRELNEADATNEALKHFGRNLTDDEKLSCAISVVERSVKYTARLLCDSDFSAMKRFFRSEMKLQVERIAFDEWKKAVCARYDNARGKYLAMAKIVKNAK